jgi:GT2 family glycosyltransferase
MIPNVFIIVLNWNNANETLKCLESLRQLNYSNYQIIVIDNGSTDNSPEIIRSSFPEITILETGENLGYAGGNNVGNRYAMGKGAEYVWILNNDTVVDNHCLEYMVQAAEADERIGMVGSKILFIDKPDTICYAGGRVYLNRGGLTWHIGSNHIDDGSFDKPMETEYITGCSVLAKREMIEDVGLLDENYFLYFEDADWSLRARQKGWKVFYEPKARLWHKQKDLFDADYIYRYLYYSFRNRLFFMKRFAPDKMFRCHFIQLFFLLVYLKNSLTKRTARFSKILKVVFQSYRDFYKYKKMGVIKTVNRES